MREFWNKFLGKDRVERQKPVEHEPRRKVVLTDTHDRAYDGHFIYSYTLGNGDNVFNPEFFSNTDPALGNGDYIGVTDPVRDTYTIYKASVTHKYPYPEVFISEVRDPRNHRRLRV